MEENHGTKGHQGRAGSPHQATPRHASGREAYVCIYALCILENLAFTFEIFFQYLFTS